MELELSQAYYSYYIERYTGGYVEGYIGKLTIALPKLHKPLRNKLVQPLFDSSVSNS